MLVTSDPKLCNSFGNIQQFTPERPLRARPVVRVTTTYRNLRIVKLS